MNAPQDDKPALAVVHRVRMLLPVRRAVWLWADADGARMSAAMSFYGILSLAPLLVLLVAGLGWWLDRDSLQQGLIAQIGTIVGEQGAGFLLALWSRLNTSDPLQQELRVQVGRRKALSGLAWCAWRGWAGAPPARRAASRWPRWRTGWNARPPPTPPAGHPTPILPALSWRPCWRGRESCRASRQV